MKLIKIQMSNFATKMAAASTKNKKDTPGKRLGVKTLGGHPVYPNDILIRQRGFKWKPGLNTFYTKDQTIHSKIEGVVKFTKEYIKKGKITKKNTYIHVIPQVHNKKIGVYNVPYCYHPELYPDLAEFNPEFTNWEIKEDKVNKFANKRKSKNVMEFLNEKNKLNLGNNKIDENGNKIVRTDFPKLSEEKFGSILLPKKYLEDKEVEEEDDRDEFVKYEEALSKRVETIDNYMKNLENV